MSKNVSQCIGIWFDAGNQRLFRIPNRYLDGVRGAKSASLRDSRIENEPDENRQPIRIFK